MASLFRPEAVEGRRQAWLGSIQLIRPVSLTVLTLLVLAVAAAAAAFLALGQYTRKAHVVGYLAPDRGVIRLLPPLAATVFERRVAEGQTVREGDALFVLTIDRSTAGGDTQAAVQQSLAARARSLREAAAQQALLLVEQRSALERRMLDMQRELAQIDAEAGLHGQRLALAQQALARLQSLQGEHFVSPAQVQSKQEEVLALQAQLSALQRQRAAQQRDIATLQAHSRELPLEAGARQGEIERELAALAQASAESDAKQRIVVRAPRAGIVSAVLADAGQSVTPDVPLASLLPAEARLQAELFAPSSAVGFVRAQQTVLLRYQAYPYQKFGHQSGRVLQVSRTPLQASELAALPLAGAASAASGGEPLYRITVALDKQAVDAYGQAQPLQPGMQIDADVLLDRRRLIEWLFEPVLGLTGKVVGRV